jgi:hypothetical protein
LEYCPLVSISNPIKTILDHFRYMHQSLINGIGMIGAFGGPYIVGYARALTNSFSAGRVVLGPCLIGSSRKPRQRDRAAEPNLGRS